jgi:hypothetical protein
VHALQWRTLAFGTTFFGDTGDYKRHTQMRNRSDFVFPSSAPLANMRSARHTGSALHACTLQWPCYAIYIPLCAHTGVSNTCEKAPSKPDAIRDPVCRTQDTHAYKTTAISPCVHGLRRPTVRLLTSLQFIDTSFRRCRSLHDSSALAQVLPPPHPAAHSIPSDSKRCNATPADWGQLVF